MNCTSFAENIIFYLDKELVPEANQAFEAHCNSCAACQQLFTQVAATYQVITPTSQVPANPFFYQQLKAKLAHEQARRKTSRVIAMLKPLAVAASIALGILIGNGELEVLLNQDEALEVAAEDAALIMPADYSVWVTMNEDYGSKN